MFNKELRERFFVSFLLSPIILIVALPNWNVNVYSVFLYLFFISLGLICLFEVIRMFESKYFYVPKIKKSLFVVFLLLFILVFSSVSVIEKGASAPLHDFSSIVVLLFSSFVLLVLINLFISSINISKNNYIFVDSVFSILSLYLGLGIGSMLALKLFDVENNTFFLSFVLGVSWFSELGGLLFGKLLGRFKLSFLSSPNKTLEGTLGMFVFALTGGVIFKLILSLLNYSNYLFIPTYQSAIVLATVVFAFDFMGDIIESLFKRFFDAKDSSNILLSLGGFFDVFDGAIMASFAVLIYIFLV
ncbi:MAG: phosphatidate cytidylyltransferase [Brevinematia bacterium]